MIAVDCRDRAPVDSGTTVHSVGATGTGVTNRYLFCDYLGKRSVLRYFSPLSAARNAIVAVDSRWVSS